MTRVLLLLGALALSSARGAAQETEIPRAQQRGAGTYYKLFTFEFRPGKTDDALGVLFQTLVPAWIAAGVQVQVIESLLGTHDVRMLIELPQGPGTLSYTVPEQDARAWTALVRIAGSSQAANEAVDRFVGHLERQSEELVFIRR
jgi:hypothetical protein